MATTRLLVGPRVVNWGTLMALTALRALMVAKALTALMALKALTALMALRALMALKALMALTVAKAVVNSMAAMTRGAESAVVKTVAVTRSQ